VAARELRNDEAPRVKRRTEEKKKKGTTMSDHAHMTRLAGCVLVLAATISMSPATVSAAPLHPAAIERDAAPAPDLIEVRAAGRHGGAVVGPRGGAASRTVVRGGAVVRPGYAGGGVRWARPGWYRWPAGGAIAAGAALGFVTAASAAAWAGAAPAPGMCWYYTDPGRTQGFWDTCP